MLQGKASTTLGLRLYPGDWGLSASDFLTAANHLMLILGEMDLALSDQSRRSMDWRIARVSYSSPVELLLEPVLREDAPVDYRAELIITSVNGLVALRDRPERPRHFSDKALQSARTLVHLLGESTQQIQIFANGTIVECNESIAAHVREILRPGKNIIGSIQGRLDRMDSHDRFEFALHEPVLNYRIKGELAQDADPSLHGQVVALFESEVVVDGILRTNPLGEVRFIVARAIRQRQRRPRLQEVTDIAGIYDITGGVEVAEYVRSMRDAE